MREQVLIKAFNYGEEWRADLVFSDTDIYLESRNAGRGVQLRADSEGEYPTTGEHFVRHRVTEPLALREWESFACEAIEPAGTSVTFRLSDGTDDYYWDGGAWVTPATAWSSAQELNDNASSFRGVVDSKKLQVVARLATTDPNLTPRLTTTKLLYRVWINFTEDLLLRSLVPTIKSQIRPWKDTAFKLKSDTDTLAIGEGGAYTVRPYKALEIVGVWDHDSDPDHRTNLLQSYDDSAEEITLTSVQATGTRLWVAFRYAPSVSVAKHPDYTEVEDLVPVLVLENLRAVDVLRGTPARRDSVIDQATGAAKVISKVDATTFDLDILVSADRDTDRMRLADAVKDYFDDNPLLNLAGVDEATPVRILNDPSFTGRPDGSGLLQDQITLRLDRLHYFPRAEDRWAVQTFVPALAPRP